MNGALPFNVPFIAVAALVGIGVFIIVYKKNLIKIAMGVAVLQAGVNLFLITLGYREGGIAPIYTNAPGGPMVLPVPQALTLTSIVIGVSILALMLSMIVHIYRHKSNLDSEESRELKG